jgi:hypothetical protein
VSPFIGGYSVGYDGLLTIRPDGRLYVQSGAGNLGTHSVIDTARVAADLLGVQQYSVALARRFHHNKPLTIMDVPADGMHQAALDIADPDTPVGARGVGEPPVGAGIGAVLAAIADAVGDDVFRRAPVTADMVLSALEAGRRTHDVLTSHI